MRYRPISFLVLILIVNLSTLGNPAKATGRASPSSKTSTKSTKAKAAKPKSSVPKSSTVAKRSAKGRIQRSAAAKREFEKQTGYPKGRPGYVVDHVVPLECGGADAPSNLQWQTVQEAKIKVALLGADYLVFQGGKATVGRLVLGSGELRELRDRAKTAIYASSSQEVSMRGQEEIGQAVALVDAILDARRAA